MACHAVVYGAAKSRLSVIEEESGFQAPRGECMICTSPCMRNSGANHVSLSNAFTSAFRSWNRFLNTSNSELAGFLQGSGRVDPSNLLRSPGSHPSRQSDKLGAGAARCCSKADLSAALRASTVRSVRGRVKKFL